MQEVRAPASATSAEPRQATGIACEVRSNGAPRQHSDLTARARIRNAALVQFAERGVAGASMRTIADAAGVSVGLVQHHFGTKDKLQQECDAYAIEFDRNQVLDKVQRAMPNLTRQQVAENPTVLVGTPRDIVEQLHQTRERYGFTYFTVLEQHSADFAGTQYSQVITSVL